MRRSTRVDGGVSIRISVYLDPNGGDAIRQTSRIIALKALESFRGSMTDTSNALGVTTKTLRRILLGGNGGEWKEKGAQLRERCGKPAEGGLPESDQTA